MLLELLYLVTFLTPTVTTKIQHFLKWQQKNYIWAIIFTSKICWARSSFSILICWIRLIFSYKGKKVVFKKIYIKEIYFYIWKMPVYTYFFVREFHLF